MPSAAKNSPNTVTAVLAYSKRFLLYGFAISIVLHLVLGPFVNWKRPNEGEQEKVEKVSVTKVVTPKPTTTPTPPPTPTPTPPPKVVSTPPPHKVERLKINVVKTTSKSSGPSENAYVSPKSGSENGVPQGNSNTGPPATVPGTATPAPTPTKAACAVPNAPAQATQKVTPDMPEIARQMGASGTAQIKVSLDANGAVTGTTVYTSTHNSALDKAALQAAQQSRYSPEIDNCVKTAGSYLYVVTFESQ